MYAGCEVDVDGVRCRDVDLRARMMLMVWRRGRERVVWVDMGRYGMSVARNTAWSD